MLSRPRPEDGEDDENMSPTVVTQAPKVEVHEPASALEDLEKRLAQLGGPGEQMTMLGDETNSLETSKDTDNSPPPVASDISKPESGAGNNALLNRIMAAQERARLAQQKLREEQALQKQQKEELKTPPPPIEELEDPSISAPPSYEEIIPTVEAPPPYEELSNKNDNLPSYEDLLVAPAPTQQAVLSEEEEQLLFLQELEHDTTTANNPSQVAEEEEAPSAPPLHELEDSANLEPDFAELYPQEAASEAYNLDDLPPSYEEFQEHHVQEQPSVSTESAPPGEQESSAFEYDSFGNLITKEEYNKVQEEQRMIMEQIQMQARAKGGTTAGEVVAGSQDCLSSAATAMNELIASRGGNTRSVTDIDASAQQPAAVAAVDPNTQVVKVGPNQRVALLDQSKTRQAIDNGTAILVECVGCQNWMQIANTAQLMFCPCCQSVCPIIRQNAVKTREEAIQLTKDRKMAESLQDKEWNPKEEGEQQGFLQTWKDYWFPDTNKEGAGVVATAGFPAVRSSVSAEAQSSNGGLHSAQVNGNEDEETDGLLPARVAQKQPHLFSCVIDSVSNLGNSLNRITAGDSEEEQDEEDVSLLAVTQSGRFGDNRGGVGGGNTEYQAL